MNLASRGLSGGVLRASGALPDASWAMLEHLGSLFGYLGGLVEASGASWTVSETVLGPPGGPGGGLAERGGRIWKKGAAPQARDPVAGYIIYF